MLTRTEATTCPTHMKILHLWPTDMVDETTDPTACTGSGAVGRDRDVGRRLAPQVTAERTQAQITCAEPSHSSRVLPHPALAALSYTKHCHNRTSVRRATSIDAGSRPTSIELWTGPPNCGRYTIVAGSPLTGLRGDQRDCPLDEPVDVRRPWAPCLDSMPKPPVSGAPGP